MKKCLDAMREEMEKSSNVHMKISTEIKAQVEKPLSALVADQSNRRKAQTKEIERSLKTKRANIALVDKTRKNYESKTKEADLAAEALSKTTSPPKEVEKLTIKSKKAVSAVEAADKEYRSCVEKLEQVTEQWEQDHITMCEVTFGIYIEQNN